MLRSEATSQSSRRAKFLEKILEHKIDASNQAFGRLASRIAHVLRGKNSPNFTPNILPQEKVIVENISKISFSGKKLDKKKYYRHSKYPGSIKMATLRERWDKDPREVFKKTVFDMLPKNRMRSKIIKNLIIRNG